MMKKIFSLIIIGLILVSGMSAFADTTEEVTITPVLYKTTEVMPVPVLISEPVPVLYDGTPVLISEPAAKVGFEVIKGLILSYENQTLSLQVEGKDYPVTIYDKDNAFENELNNFKVNDSIEVIAEYGEATFYLYDIKGVTPVLYDVIPTLIASRINVYYNDEIIDFDVNAQKVNGVTMIPLRATLEKMGYKVEWKQETSSVEISKGAQWTSIKIGENRYFKNKMAPRPLSAAPTIVDGRALVPAEFFTVILSKGVEVENGILKLSDENMAIHSGYVKEVSFVGEGKIIITITSDLASDEIYKQTIIHTSSDTTFFNTEVFNGKVINVITPPVMTMSIPGQTSGIIVY